MMDAPDILPEGVLCQTLWRRQLHQSHSSTWNGEDGSTGATTASGIKEGSRKKKKNTKKLSGSVVNFQK